MTCQEFCKTFDVYITFSKSGYGQIFGKGSHPPNYLENMDFWVPTNGGDTGLLPSLVEDYQEFSSKCQAVLISPEGSKSKSIKKEKTKDGKIPIMECNDFKPDDTVETNVDVVRVSGWPDTAHLKLDEYIYRITMYDGKHHFMYQTKSKDHPEEGDKVLLKAKIKKQTDQIDHEIPMFEVASVKILKAKKS